MYLKYKLWGLIHTQLHEPAQMRLKFMACTTNIHWLVPFSRTIKRIPHLVPIRSILDVFFIYLTLCFQSDEVCTVNNKVLLVIICGLEHLCSLLQSFQSFLLNPDQVKRVRIYMFLYMSLNWADVRSVPGRTGLEGEPLTQTRSSEQYLDV